MNTDTTQQRRWVIDVEENPDNPDEAIIQLPPEALRLAGLQAGDTVKWTPLDNGAYTLTKVDSQPAAVAAPTQLVLVETVNMFRIRYLIETPPGKEDWALDDVVMNEACEFSQRHLDETIVSHRVVDRDEALRICRADNQYAAGWSDEQLERIFWTAHKPEEGAA